MRRALSVSGYASGVVRCFSIRQPSTRISAAVRSTAGRLLIGVRRRRVAGLRCALGVLEVAQPVAELMAGARDVLAGLLERALEDVGVVRGRVGGLLRGRALRIAAADVLATDD